MPYWICDNCRGHFTHHQQDHNCTQSIADNEKKDKMHLYTHSLRGELYQMIHDGRENEWLSANQILILENWVKVTKEWV